MTAAQVAQVEQSGPRSWFGLLEGQAWRLAQALHAISRRRDVRERRAKIVLLLLDLACPENAKPRRRWYIPGAVARVGPRGLMRAWGRRFGEKAPSERTVRSHLGALEAAGVLVRAPGDWLPVPRDRVHPERRPRYPDTYHLLESDESAEWWARVGHPLLARHPEARHSPDRWRMLFGRWRERVAGGEVLVQQELWDAPLAPPVQPPCTPPRTSIADAPAAAGVLAGSAHDETMPADELVVALDAAGVRVGGRPRLEIQQDELRLRGVLALMAVALRRGDVLRSPAGWVVRAYRRAPEADLHRALDRTAAWSVQPPRRRRTMSTAGNLADTIGQDLLCHLRGTLVPRRSME